MRRQPALLTILTILGLVTVFPSLCFAYCIHGRSNCWHCGTLYSASYSHTAYFTPPSATPMLLPSQLPPSFMSFQPPSSGPTSSVGINVPGTAIAPGPVAAGVFPVASPFHFSGAYMMHYPVAAYYVPYAPVPSAINEQPSASSPPYLTGVDMNSVEPRPVAAGEPMSPPRFAGHLLHRLEYGLPPGSTLDRQVVLAHALQFYHDALSWPWSTLPISTFDRHQIEKLVDRFFRRRAATQVASSESVPPPPPSPKDSPASRTNETGPAIPPSGLAAPTDNPNEIEITFRIKLPAGMKIAPK